jgi:phage shock protein PspC (stress-responsive transcriptional regulator)
MLMIPMSDSMNDDFALKKVRIGAKPFVRPRDDRIILGVCSGVARKLGINSMASRVIFSLLTLFTGGSLAIVYPIIFLLSPSE